MNRLLVLMIFLLSNVSMEGQQLLYDDGNEPHAIFIQKNPYTTNPDNFTPSPYDSDNPYHPNNPYYSNINITNEPTPQNEPSVCISRVNSNIVVAAWRDFRLGWQEPDIVRRIGYSYSTDGGKTWSTPSLLPDPEPEHNSQSDPVVVCDMDGNFYISSTSRQTVPGYNRQMLLYKSVDNGQTFSLHAIAAPGSGSAGEDKEWLFCDMIPTNPTYNHLMMVWRSFGPSYGIKFTKSDVGGTNWGSWTDVSDWGSGQGANITTGLDGRIIVVWTDDGIVYDISYDGGETFGTDRNLSFQGNYNGSFPFVCTDLSQNETRGNIYITWAESHTGSGDDVMFQRSEDGGETWLSQPVRINNIASAQQYWPAIRVDDQGRIFVIYYDEKYTAGKMDATLAYSLDGGDTWTNERLSAQSFSGNIPNSDVRFGDYIHLDAFDGKVVTVWSDDRAGSYNQEIYTADLDLVTLGIKDPQITNQLILKSRPNPFTESMTIDFHLEKSSWVSIKAYNSTGSEIENIFEGNRNAGTHSIEWNAQHPAGIYHVKVESSTKIGNLKVIKLN